MGPQAHEEVYARRQALPPDRPLRAKIGIADWVVPYLYEFATDSKRTFYVY